jgi:ABC-type uncharacterized transport system involved in gliding motility auxiliary subunit
MRRLWSSVLGVIAVAAILVGINILADSRLADVQLDLTQQKLYTLSPGTRQIIAGLKEPLTLRLYYSRSLGSRVPQYGAYADRVREMLTQYASISHGMLRLKFYDPQPYSDTEDHAMAYGLQGVPVDQSGEQVYFGLAGSNMLDDERTIAFFQPARERFLEYDLTRLIYELSNPKRPVVGVMSSLPVDGDPREMMMQRAPGGPGSPYVSMLQLRQTFAVQTVPLDAQVIDPAIQVLLVAQAQKLSQNTLYAIDQFVMRGGRLMVMVDPLSEAQNVPDPQTGEPPADTSSDLKKLFDAWGIQYDRTKVAADLTGAWQVRGDSTGETQAVDYVAWYNIRSGISHDDPATADLSQVTVASPGFIAKKPGAAITFTPLLSTDDQSEVLPATTFKNMPDPARILADFKPDGVRRVIAARVRGVLKSAFTGPPPPLAGKPRPADFPAYRAQTAGPANLVVIADSDLLTDRFWVRSQDFFGQQDTTPFSDNGPFVVNLVGTLSGNDALIGLRSRGSSLRPFDLVDHMQQQAEARYRKTEQALQAHLDATQKQLVALRTGNGAAGGTASATPVITEQQRAAIDDLRRDAVATRTKLRAVQFDLRRNITALENNLRLFNIVMVPAVLALLAIVLGLIRSRRRARARA